MKNKTFIQALNKVEPSKNKKDKMLENILSRKRKTKFSINYVWKLGMVSLCFVFCFLIVNGFEKEDMGINPTSIGPRTAMEETNDLCYQNICYEKVKGVKNKEGMKYLDTVYDNNKKFIIYQGEQKDTIIVKCENSYFLYQKIER